MFSLPRCACAAMALTFITYSVRAVTPASQSGAEFSLIAKNAFAGSSVNVVANIRYSLFTRGSTQFAAFYDGDAHLVLAKRSLSAGPWETRRSNHRGNVADAHNSISLVVDGAGFLHVAWDHHVSPLHYARSLFPGSLELAPPTSMTGQRESHVTYPQFFDLPNGDLLFLYRDGSSGRGGLALNRYSVATQTWSAVQPNLIDGEGQRSPYWGMTVDSHGALHLAWIWRDSPDVASNHDIAYARSIDGGITWITAAGAPCTLPLTFANCDYAVRIPTAHNLMNSPMVVADERGHPYLTTYWSNSPESAPQFHVAWHNGKAWQTRPVDHPLTKFTLAGAATKRPPISRGVLFVRSTSDQTAAHLVYRDDSRGGRVVAVSTPDLDGGSWSTADLTTESVGAWEPSFDPGSWQQSHRFDSLLQQVRQLDGNDKAPAAAPPSEIGVLSWSPSD